MKPLYRVSIGRCIDGKSFDVEIAQALEKQPPVYPIGQGQIMPTQSSDSLRTRYRELLLNIDVKLRTGENTDNEESEIMEVCRLLDERGYEINADGSDWIRKLSPENWQGKDED